MAGDARRIKQINDFNSESIRIDHTISSRQRLFARYSYNNRIQDTANFTGAVNGLLPTGTFENRPNHSAAYDHVYSFNSTTLFNFRLGFTRQIVAPRPQSLGFDPASLGFSARTVSQFGGDQYLPRFTIGGFSSIGGNTGSSRATNLYTAQPTVTKIFNKHNARVGYDFRAYRENNFPTANTASIYTFGTDFTRQNDQTSTAATIGQQFAASILMQQARLKRRRLPLTRKLRLRKFLLVNSACAAACSSQTKAIAVFIKPTKIIFNRASGLPIA